MGWAVLRGGCNSCGGAGAGAYPPPGAQAAARVRPRGLPGCPAGPQGGSARPPWAGSDAVLLPFVSSKLSGMPAAQQALPRPGGPKRPDAAARGRLRGPCVPMFRQAAVLTFFRRFPANVLKGVRQRVRPAVPVMYQRSRGRAAAFMNRIRPSGRSPRAAPCSFFPHWGTEKQSVALPKRNYEKEARRLLHGGPGGAVEPCAPESQ